MASSIKNQNNTSSNPEISPAELYAIRFQNAEPANFSMVPNIIDHLTYDYIDEKTGVKTVKKLSIYAKALYQTLKTIAGEHGACWQNRNNLAELANMSAGSISNAKEELQQKFHQLDSNPLIVIEKHSKITAKNKTEYDKIFIADIWKWNNAYMATLKFQKMLARSQDDRAHEARSQDDRAFDPTSQGARSPHDTIKTCSEKDPMFKEQHPAAGGENVDVFLHKKEKERMFPSDAHKENYEWMIAKGCDADSAHSLALTNLEEFKKSVEYTNKRLGKNKEKGKKNTNPWGYLRRTIQQKWWKKAS